jgi:hypothetical protein
MKRFLILLLSIVGSSAFAQTCTTTISPGANVSSAVSSAAAGATVCLNSGNWGDVTFSGVVKSAYVTVRSASGVGATISPYVTGGSQFIRLSNLTISGMSLDGASTKHIVVADSTFTQKLDIVTTNFNSNDILIDGNTFNGIDSGGGTEGRVNVRWPNGPGSVPAGVTLSNNTFSGAGCSDGVQLGAYGVVVGPGNYFTNLPQGNCSEHVDSIQGYGQSHSVIRGNYFYKPRVCLGFYDGGNGELFENNIFVGNGSDGTQCVIDLGSITSSTFRHNTVYNSSPRVGGINSSGGGSGTYTENIMSGSSFNSGPLSSCSSCTFTHNMFSNGGNGSNNIIASATFVGGSSVTAWAGWALTSASAGYRAALDGTDMGAIIGQGGGTPTAPVTLPPPTALRVLP